MTHHECTTGNANEKSEDVQSSGIIDQSRHGSRDGRRTQDGRKEDASTVLVTKRSQDKTHEDSTTDTDNRRRPDLLGGQMEGGTNLRQQRSDGKPNEECAKEREPRAMKGSHVRTFEVAQLDLDRLVVLVGVHFDAVHGVLLPVKGVKREGRGEGRSAERGSVSAGRGGEPRKEQPAVVYSHEKNKQASQDEGERTIPPGARHRRTPFPPFRLCACRRCYST